MAPRPTLRPLVTPKNMLFPSELNDRPMTPASLSPRTAEDGDRTAITPPPAYTEFLNAMTPVFASPAGSEFPRSPLDKSSSSYFRSSSSRSPSSSISPPSTAVKPSFSTGYRGRRSKPGPAYLAPPPPTAPIGSISPSRVPYPSRHLPYPTPTSASASSSASFLSPHAYDPSPTRDYHYATYSPRSANMYSLSARSPHSASDWKARALESPRSAGGPRSAKPSPLGLRQVVTRTVTYRPGPAPALHPPPRGKRRKSGKYLAD